MERAPVYNPPILGIKGSKNNVKYWDIALECFDEKKYRETIINVLNYLNPDLAKDVGSADTFTVLMPHGSIEIELTVTGNHFQIYAPFLRLPRQRLNVILRQAAEINFSTLFLSQIKLKDDELCFNFRAPLELCEPTKLYKILYEICVYADYYDDIFIQELGAARIHKLKVKHFNKDELLQLWQKYKEYLKEALEYLDFFQLKRIYDLGIDSCLISLMKLDYYLQPQGKLRSDIEETINYVYKYKLPASELLNKLIANIKKLAEIEQSKFFESIYVPEFLISVKKRAELPIIKDILQKSFEAARINIGQNDYKIVVFNMLYAIYKLFYGNTVPVRVEEILNKGLKKSSGAHWEQAALALFNAVSDVMDLNNIKNKNRRNLADE